ncbi:MAG: peptidase M15 [Vicingus serpentipes]|nr:peptidase M15 [Vicingus serpentipes]
MKVQDWGQVKYFDAFEFDSPDLPGSGREMDQEFILLLDQARELAGEQGQLEGMKIVFSITSGYRTESHNKKIGGVSDSAHLTGNAADIRVRNGKERRIILNSLIKVGLDKRIGIGQTFIHVDNDFNKPFSYWTYPVKSSNVVANLIKGLINKKEDI